MSMWCSLVPSRWAISVSATSLARHSSSARSDGVICKTLIVFLPTREIPRNCVDIVCGLMHDDRTIEWTPPPRLNVCVSFSSSKGDHDWDDGSSRHAEDPCYLRRIEALHRTRIKAASGGGKQNRLRRIDCASRGPMPRRRRPERQERERRAHRRDQALQRRPEG